MESILLWANAVVLLALPFLPWAFKSYLGKYLEEKGRNLATKEDFAELLRQQKETTKELESIKATVSGEMWVAQQRWQYKCDNYTALIKALATLRSIVSELQSLEPTPEEPNTEEQAKEPLKRMGTLIDQMNLDVAVGRLWLSTDALKALKDMIDGMRAPTPHVLQGWADSGHAVDTALRLLVALGRQELMAV